MDVSKAGLDGLSEVDRSVVDSWLVDFDQNWDERQLARRVEKIPTDSALRLPTLVEMVKIDLERRWRLGREPSLESYMSEFPELGRSDDVSLDLIAAEYEIRRQYGVTATLDDYLRRFPHQSRGLRRLIALPNGSIVPESSQVRTRSEGLIQPPGTLPEKFGRYRIVGRLGKGGMGSVYLAEDTKLGRRVALKVSDFDDNDPEARQRFEEEARAAATLDHPYLCPIYDFGEVDGRPYLTMMYIEGKSLAEAIRVDGMPARQVAALVGKLALALDEAHDKGVIHRDLKPANIMIKSTGKKREPVIVDFGLARRDDGQDIRLTKSGQVIGTLAYMSPEQIRGERSELGPSCDIYALGVILYELLTGELPFDGTGLAVAAKILTQNPQPPTKHRPDLDLRLEAICLKAMSKKASERYASMKELAGALTRFLQIPVTATDTHPPAETPSAPRTGQESLVAQLFQGLSTETPAISGRDSDLDLTTPDVPATQSGLSGIGRRVWVAIAASSVVLLAVFGIVIYVATDNGQIRIEIDDPQAVIVKLDGKDTQIEGLGEVLSLRAGAHDLVVKWGDGEFQTKDFRVKRGENVPVRIRYEPKLKDGVKADREQAKPQTLSNVAERIPSVLLTFNGHSEPVQDVAFSPDGQRIASAGWDKTVRVWNAVTGLELLTLNGHADAVKGVAYSPDGRRIASSSWDKTVKVWDAATGQELFTCNGHSDHVIGVAFSPDGHRIASSSWDGTAKVWDAATGQEILTFSGHTLRVMDVSFSPDSQRVASADEDKTVKVWNAATGEEILTLVEHTEPVIGVAFSPDGQRIASGGQDKTLKVWNAVTGERIFTREHHTGGIACVAFSPDSRRIATASFDKTVKVWDAETGEDIFTLTGHSEPVRGVTFSPDGQRIASGSEDKSAKVWDVPSPRAGEKSSSKPN